MSEAMNFIEGVHRVSKIVFGAGNYDSIVDGVKSTTYDGFDSCTTPKCQIDFAIALLSRALDRGGAVFSDNKSVDIAFFGKTKNNLREFDFFLARASKFLADVSTLNLCNCQKERVNFPRSAKDLVLSRVGDYLRSLPAGSISKALIRQIILYSISYLCFEIAFKKEACALLVLANDHSPEQVALSMMAKAIGVPRLYIQHAEVTEIFPQLDFEYSILRNQRSLTVYEKSGPVFGNVCYYQRDSGSFDINQLQKNLLSIKDETRIDVVIYPTAVILKHEFNEFIKSLRASSCIRNIYIKPHPSKISTFRDLLDDSQIPLLERFPDFTHVAVVGNSSVVTELIKKSVPVIQVFGVDPIRDDYYGYFSGGIVGAVGVRDGGEIIGKLINYDDEWLNGFSKFDSSIATPNNLLMSASFEIFILKMLREVGLTKNFKQSIDRYYFARLLRIAPLTFSNAANSGKFKDEVCIDIFEHLFSERDPGFVDFLATVKPLACDSFSYAWLLLKRQEWTGIQLVDEDFDKVFNFILGHGGDKSVVAKMEAALCDALIRRGEASRLFVLLNSVRYLRLEKMSINRLISVRKLVGDGLLQFEQIKSKLPGFNLLKFRVQALNESIAHQDLIHEFRRHATPPLAKDFDEYVCTAYDEIADRLQYMDVFVDARQRNEIYSRIIQCLRDGEAFSLLRLSDGEGYIFKEGKDDIFTDYDARNRELHWWGEHIDVDAAEKLRFKLREAVRTADVIGIPGLRRFIRDNQSNSTSLMKSLTGRGLLQVLNGVNRIASKDSVFTDDKVNNALFSRSTDLEELMAHSKSVVLIGGANETEVRKCISFKGQLAYLKVPTHFKFKNNSKFSVDSRPLPYVIDDIANKLQALADPGVLVLVAAGVAGKYFNSVAKENGAVAVDIGSSFDLVLNAGVHSLY